MGIAFVSPIVSGEARSNNVVVESLLALPQRPVDVVPAGIGAKPSAPAEPAPTSSAMTSMCAIFNYGAVVGGANFRVGRHG